MISDKNNENFISFHFIIIINNKYYENFTIRIKTIDSSPILLVNQVKKLKNTFFAYCVINSLFQPIPSIRIFSYAIIHRRCQTRTRQSQISTGFAFKSHPKTNQRLAAHSSTNTYQFEALWLDSRS